MPNKQNIIKKFLDILRFERHDIWSIYFYAIMAGIVQLSLPLGIQSIISFVLGGSLSTSIVILIIVVILGVFIAGLLQVNQMKIIEKIEQQLFVRYSFKYADTIPKLNLKTVNNHYLPELVNRFFDTISLQKGISKLLLDIPTATIQILFGLILLSFYHPIFIFLGFSLLVILFLILRTTGNRGLDTSLQRSNYKYRVAGYLQELARAVTTFKFSKNSNYHINKIDEYTTKYLNASTMHFRILLFQYWTLIGLKVLITSMMLIIGTYLLLNQQLNIGQFIAAEIVILLVINSVEKLIGNLDKVYDVLTSVEKLSKVSEKPTEPIGASTISGTEGLSVQLHNVTFSYITESPVLKNITLDINSGNKVCIVGEGNSGKTTLLKIICGLYRVDEGNVIINSIPINSYNTRKLRSSVGVFLGNRQDIFEGTIKENICLGDNSITHEELNTLAQKTGLKSFLDNNKEGYEYTLLSNGQGLSYLITKKLLLMRALTGKPKLLLLENPWEGMAKNEVADLQQYLLNELPNTTILVITNDTQFAEKCDSILTLENGTIKS